MPSKHFVVLGAALLAACAHAQTAAPAAPASPSTPAKKELVARILKLQQPGVEALARGLVEQPAAELLGRAGPALAQRVAPDKQEAVAKDIQADAKKFVDDTFPTVRDRAVQLAPSTIGPVLEAKFSEDELKQVAQILESQAFRRYQELGGDMQKALADKLVADTRGTVEPKVRALEASIGKRLGVTPPPASGNAPAAAAPAAKPAARPASR
jgi:hypothetical protein